MAAGDVHRELTVAGEPFCGLLGMTVGQKDPFVLENILSLSVHGITLVYCTSTCTICCTQSALCVHTYIELIHTPYRRS